MSFAGKVWRLLVGIKDALALLFLLSAVTGLAAGVFAGRGPGCATGLPLRRALVALRGPAGGARAGGVDRGPLVLDAPQDRFFEVRLEVLRRRMGFGPCHQAGRPRFGVAFPCRITAEPSGPGIIAPCRSLAGPGVTPSPSGGRIARRRAG